jgi:hypothetical protein
MSHTTNKNKISTSDATQQQTVVDAELENSIDGGLLLGQHVVQRRRLRKRAREAVENESFRALNNDVRGIKNRDKKLSFFSFVSTWGVPLAWQATPQSNQPKCHLERAGPHP